MSSYLQSRCCSYEQKGGQLVLVLCLLGSHGGDGRLGTSLAITVGPRRDPERAAKFGRYYLIDRYSFQAQDTQPKI